MTQVARYRTETGIRDVHVLDDATGWVILDVCGPDRREVERLRGPGDGQHQALAVAADYARQAEIARQPLAVAPEEEPAAA